MYHRKNLSLSLSLSALDTGVHLAIKTKTNFSNNTNSVEFRNRDPKDRENLEWGKHWLDSLDHDKL